MEINKESIQNLINDGKLKKALSQLLDLVKANDEDLVNTVIMQNGRFNSLLRQERNGGISNENANLSRNRITSAILSILDELDDDVALENEDGGSKGKSSSKNSKNSSQWTILFVAANPRDSDSLRLGEEYSRIKSGLTASKYRDNIILEQQWATKINDLLKAVLNYTPDIVHFSGHGSEEGEILLEDAEGYSKTIAPEALGIFFSNFKSTVKCVVLNACHSEIQAREILKHIPFVVGMNTEIPDDAANQFAEAFYEALGAGREIPDAFSIGKTAIAMNDMDDAQIPVLLSA